MKMSLKKKKGEKAAEEKRAKEDAARTMGRIHLEEEARIAERARKKLFIEQSEAAREA